MGELTDVRPVPDRRVHAGCDAARSKSPACDELGRDQNEFQETHGRIVDLHDFAPVGYLALDVRGLIAAANLAGTTLLGAERNPFLRRRPP